MKHRAWFWLLVVVAVTAGSSATAGLGGGSTAAAGRGTQAAQERDGTLRISRARDIDSVDPAIAYLPDSWMLEFATCAKLYNYPDKPAPVGAIPIPEVATGLPKISEDGRTQTIQLKRTFRFHSGQPVTAVNFVAAFNRNANPKLQSPAMTYLHEVVGADAVIAGNAQTITGVRALGRYTLQIRTTQALTDLVSRLTMPFFCPIAVNTPLEEIDDPLGSGPYYVSSRVPNRQTVLARNPFYRGSRTASIDQIVYAINGLEACRAAVERNELDYCAGAGIPTASYREVAAKYGVNTKGGQFFVNPTLAMNFFVFNHERPAFKGKGQIPLKQAINWAIDRHALAQAAGYLSGKRTDQILPPAMARPASIYSLGGVSERSLTRARALLNQVKVRPEKLVLYTRNVTYEVVWAQIFRFNLKRLGIDVEIKVFPADTYWDVLGSRGEPFDIAVHGWVADYPDGATFYLPLLYGPGITKRGTQNFAYFDRPKYNRAIERIGRLRGESRHRAWADLDVEMMRDDPPWAPIGSGVDRAFVSKSFGCFVFQPAIGRPNLAAACKK